MHLDDLTDTKRPFHSQASKHNKAHLVSYRGGGKLAARLGGVPKTDGRTDGQTDRQTGGTRSTTPVTEDKTISFADLGLLRKFFLFPPPLDGSKGKKEERETFLFFFG